MTQVAWRGFIPGSNGPENRAGEGTGMNMPTIAMLRKYAEITLGPTVLIIERSEAGTKIALRFLRDEQAYEIHLRALNELRCKRVKRPWAPEALYALACVCAPDMRRVIVDAR